MRRFHALLLVVPAVAALAAGGGCTINESSSPSGGGGTTPIPTSQARAMLEGSVDSSVGSSVSMSVNGQAENVVLAPDQSFVVRDVPTGDVTFECDADNVRGTLTISNVQPGEIIEIEIKREGDAIVIVIMSRTQSTQPPQEVSEQGGDALKITASHVCYWLKPGHYSRDIIVTGDDVHLFGAAHQSCVIDDFSILDGRLELDGNHCTVLDVDLTGALVVSGQDDKVQDSCTHCLNDGCEHACGDESHAGHACGQGGGGQPDSGTGGNQDAAMPGNDAGGGSPDAGMPAPDAGGGTPDAGMTPDASGGGSDAGASDARASDAPSGG